MSPSPTSPRRAGGFTLLELTIVMGILSGFLVMLVQLVSSGLSMFGEGELGQALADRSSQAQRVITRELSTLRGSASARDRDRVDDRLVVQSLPIGLPPLPERGATRVQVLRAAVHLPPDRELLLLEGEVTRRLNEEKPELKGDELVAAVQKQLGLEPLRGVGNLLLLPWRQEGDDALLELRAGWFLPGQELPLSKERSIDPFQVPVPGSPDLPGMLVYQVTMPVLRDLLHVEFLLWGQATTAWGDETALAAASTARSAPQQVWDSSRGGWLVDEASGGAFVYDRGPLSADDATDDIHPHAILVRCVVAQPAEIAAEGLLDAELYEGDTSLTLVDGARFPGAEVGGFVKIDGEWLRYAERDGDQLRGLVRGARRTKATTHAVGSRVHVGRRVEFVVPVLHAKDDWNG
ncbi:MAG: hypothetical protein JNN13_07595 [Planctomycetes bacterium]|nr:hypothetical protein [Planctomycetota bacterium]